MNQKLVDLVLKLLIATRNARMHDRQAKRTHHTLFGEKNSLSKSYPNIFFSFFDIF
jgi:hypothetical protein